MEIGTLPVLLKPLTFKWVFFEMKGCSLFLQLFDQMCMCPPLGYCM